MVNTLIAEGVQDAEIARRAGVSRQAVTAYKHRNQAVIAPLVEANEKQLIDLWIADQRARAEKRQQLYEETDVRRQSLPERAGMTYAAMVREQRAILDDAEPKDKGATSETFVLIRERVIERGARLEPLG